ncbi:MAG TPA: UDP-N-acetylglucosamine 1-carboxyvinyltransferase [Clostridiales bacterium UBA8153]|nr:UDP-N-acetylglucosamine 1-carboxyvinyltransferase [Clostridiales bacterium UBA8153]
MDTMIIQGGTPLRGNVRVSGAKNAVLPMLAAALLAEGDTVLHGVPALDDVFTMGEVLTGLGASVDFPGGGRAVVRAADLGWEADPRLVRRMRASFLVAGPILARTGRMRISMPGGCAIGSRPIDLHLKGLRSLGARVEQDRGCIELSLPGRSLTGALVYLDYPSVGATENLMAAACLARGETIIDNAASEPEVVDLAGFLTAMGGQIAGAGSKVIRIRGQAHLRGAQHTVIPDRIEAATFMAAAAATGGHLRLENVEMEHLQAVTAKLREAGVTVEPGSGGYAEVWAAGRLRAADIKTMPHPGFPTDMQPQLLAAMTVAQGTSVISETVFDNRFHHVDELRRMGACITVEGRCAVVRGVPQLSGAAVRATDLRAAAGLVLAGLAAAGETRVMDAHHLDRGYEDLVGKLRSVGADVTR